MMSNTKGWRLALGFAAAAAFGQACNEERGTGGSGATGGYGGFGGSAGLGGTGSVGGAAGVSGVGGAAGYAGLGGMGGLGGASGLGGAGGVGATGGSGGDAGIGGSGGDAGIGGSGGEAGFAGIGGSGGEAGVGATGGSGGTSGVGGGGSGGSGGGLVRGPAPTEQSASSNGPYTIAMYTNGFNNPPGGFSAATIYYPSNADAPFAMVVICPGYTARQNSIAAWGPFFASHGIVTMTIDTAATGDSVVMRSQQLIEALESLKAENSRAGAPLNGKLDLMRAGLMGWSMGGGGTWIASNSHPELRTGVSLAGHISTAIGAQTNMITVPTFLCAGNLDPAFLGGGMSQPVYASIPSTTPKMLYEVSGGDHNVCNRPTTNNGITGRYILSWQKVFLEGDDRYRQFLQQMPAGTSDFDTNFQ